MIHDLDASLKKFLAGEAAPQSVLSDAKISCVAPEKDWRSTAESLHLNLYLYRVVENRELRSTERRVTRSADGLVTQERAPARIDCTYLITAWNLAAKLGAEDRERQEHMLLGQVLFVLLRNPVIPRGYLAGSLATTQEIDLPTIVAQMDDMANIPDFWSGFETHVRPAIACKVTLSIDLALAVTGTAVASAGIGLGDAQSFVIGGAILDAGARGVAGAWVRVEETGRVYVADADGRFTIDRIERGAYTLRVRAVGFKEGIRSILVPATEGVYAVTLVPW